MSKKRIRTLRIPFIPPYPLCLCFDCSYELVVHFCAPLSQEELEYTERLLRGVSFPQEKGVEGV